MIDELEFDATLAGRIAHGHELLPMLHLDQFKRAIAAGAISGLRDEIKVVVLDAYGAIERANAAVRRVESSLAGSAESSVSGPLRADASKAYGEAGVRAKKAVEELLRFLGSEASPEERGD
jgi:hypothetical protein